MFCSRFVVFAALFSMAQYAVAAATPHPMFVTFYDSSLGCDSISAIVHTTYKNGTCMHRPSNTGGVSAWPQRVNCVTATADSAWTWTFFREWSCSNDDRYGKPFVYHGVGAQCVAGPSVFMSVDCSRASPYPTEFPVQLLQPTGKCPFTNSGVVTNNDCVPVPAALNQPSYKSMRMACVHPHAHSRAVLTLFKDSSCKWGRKQYFVDAYMSLRRDCSQPVNMFTSPLLANCAGPDDHSFDPAPANFSVVLKRAQHCPIIPLERAFNRECKRFSINNVIRYAQPNCVKHSANSEYTISTFSDASCTSDRQAWIRYPFAEMPCGEPYSPQLLVECGPKD